MPVEENKNIHRIKTADREITLIGTAHVSRDSAELVEKVVRIAREFDRDIASPDEVRTYLKLKGKDKVNF